MKSCFEKEGFKVTAMASFNVEDDNIVGRISTNSIENACLGVGKIAEVDGVFISCTNMRIGTIHKLRMQERGRGVSQMPILLYKLML